MFIKRIIAGKQPSPGALAKDVPQSHVSIQQYSRKVLFPIMNQLIDSDQAKPTKLKNLVKAINSMQNVPDVALVMQHLRDEGLNHLGFNKAQLKQLESSICSKALTPTVVKPKATTDQQYSSRFMGNPARLSADAARQTQQQPMQSTVNHQQIQQIITVP